MNDIMPKLKQIIEQLTQGLSPTVGKDFSFCNFSLSSIAVQLDYAITNLIKRDIHLAKYLFKQGNCMYFLFHLFCFWCNYYPYVKDFLGHDNILWHPLSPDITIRYVIVTWIGSFKVFPEGLMVDMASKKYSKMYCVLHSSSNENRFALSTNTVLATKFPTDLNSTRLCFLTNCSKCCCIDKNFFNMCHTLKTRLNT